MKLFYAPGACSMGTHIVLEEIGKPFEAHRVNFAEQEQYKPPFAELNPKGKVPTLQRDDGSVLTEFPVIAHWLAEQHPESNLLPAEKEAALHAAETMDYCVATIHMQGFSRQFRPSNFAPSEADADRVKARGREIAEKGFAIVSKALGDKEYLGGTFSVADTALFYVAFWGGKRIHMALPANIEAHLDRMLARPAVQRMLATEGIAA